MRYTSREREIEQIQREDNSTEEARQKDRTKNKYTCETSGTYRKKYETSVTENKKRRQRGS